jgi:hypothetical protein
MTTADSIQVNRGIPRFVLTGNQHLRYPAFHLIPPLQLPYSRTLLEKAPPMRFFEHPDSGLL